MRKFLIVFVILALVLIGLFTYHLSKDPSALVPIEDEGIAQQEQEFQDWHGFIAPDEAFTVRLPYLPQHAEEHVQDPKTGKTRTYNMYIAEKPNGTIFMINVITFRGEEISDKDKLMRKMMNDLIASDPSNVLKTVEKGSYRGHESLDFSFDNPSMKVEAKTFMKENTLFILSHVSHGGNSKEYNFFIDSFELQNKE